MNFSCLSFSSAYFFFASSENVPLINLLEVDTQKVRDTQIERLHKVKANRNNQALEIALDELEQIAISGNGRKV